MGNYAEKTKKFFYKKNVEEKTKHVCDWTRNPLIRYLAQQCAARDWEFSLILLRISCERFAKRVIADINMANNTLTITVDGEGMHSTYLTG